MKEMAMNWFDVPDGVTQRVIARCGVQVAGTCPPLQKLATVIVSPATSTIP